MIWHNATTIPAPNHRKRKEKPSEVTTTGDDPDKCNFYKEDKSREWSKLPDEEPIALLNQKKCCCGCSDPFNIRLRIVINSYDRINGSYRYDRNMLTGIVYDVPDTIHPRSRGIAYVV